MLNLGILYEHLNADIINTVCLSLSCLLLLQFYELNVKIKSKLCILIKRYSNTPVVCLYFIARQLSLTSILELQNPIVVEKIDGLLVLLI